MIFFFDTHHSPKIARILKDNGVDARHMLEVFPRGMEDVEWLPEIGQRGWVLITGDHNIRRRKVEKEAFEKANIIAFFVSRSE